MSDTRRRHNVECRHSYSTAQPSETGLFTIKAVNQSADYTIIHISIKTAVK